MKKTCILLSLVWAALGCGCDKQTRANTEKIEVLSQKIVQIQQSQSKQLEVIQLQIASLAPMLTQTNSYYFAKSYENALFFHTNTLFLLLNIGKNIEAQLQIADTERAAENLLQSHYYTNQAETIYYCTAKITSALVNQEKQIEDNINAETRRVSAALSEALLNQIKLLSLDKTEVAKRAKMEADVAQIQRDLDTIKARLAITNQPATQPQ